MHDSPWPFDPLTVAPPDRTAPLAERKVGGFGIHFVRNLLIELAYQRIGDRNRLVLTKSLSAGFAAGKDDIG